MASLGTVALVVGLVAAVFGVLRGLSAFYSKIISPRLTRTKLHRFYALVEEWYAFIDEANITLLNMSELGAKEKRVQDFLNDSGLAKHILCFPRGLRRRFLKLCGLRRDLRSDAQLFEKYSRCPASGIVAQSFWWQIQGDFLEFKKHDDTCDPRTNIGNVEIRIKLLKMLVRAKAT